MRKIVAALQISLDGFIEGRNGEIDWVDSWEDPFDLLPEIDTCILGAGMYPGYQQYWSAILADPKAPLPFGGGIATEGEIAYARFAGKTPHLVVSKKLEKVTWKNTRVVRDLDDIRKLKKQPGKAMHAVGGAALVSSLMNENLVDELRLVVQPFVLGGGKALFKDVEKRHALHLVEAKTLQSGKVRLTYGVRT